MGEFAFKVVSHVSFVVVVAGFAYIGCSGCGTCSPRMPNEASKLAHYSSTADDPGKVNIFHSTINSFNLMAPAVGPSGVSIDIDGAYSFIHSFIHCVVNKGLLSSWSDKNCIVMRARKRRHEGMSSSFIRQSMLPQP